jgi:hypothetical protein
MLVSHLNKFIFTKTQKTGGTSVEVFFERHCFPKGEWTFSGGRDQYVNDETGIVGYRGGKLNPTPIFYNHMSALELKQKLAPEIWKKYFKFTVIRNPFDKMVSAFYHIEKSRNQGKYLNDDSNDVIRFRRWVQGGGKVYDRHAYIIDDKVALDYFIRYENLKEDIAFVCNKVGIDCDLNNLPNLKSQHRDRSFSLNEMYDEKTEALVRKYYKFEIDFFNYDLEVKRETGLA